MEHRANGKSGLADTLGWCLSTNELRPRLDHASVLSSAAHSPRALVGGMRISPALSDGRSYSHKVYILVSGNIVRHMFPPNPGVSAIPCSGTSSLTLPYSFMPETLRSYVGDGSLPPPRGYAPLIPVVGRNREGDVSDPAARLPKRSFHNPLRLFLLPDVTLLLFFNGVVYAVFYGVTTSISVLFEQTYPYLSETDIGLCFLAIGGGMLFGGVAAGRIIDKEYRRVKTQMIAASEKELDPDKRLKIEDITKEENFPIEKARLRIMPLYLATFVTTCIIYGWLLEAKVNIAGPLIIQIVCEYYGPSKLIEQTGSSRRPIPQWASP